MTITRLKQIVKEEILIKKYGGVPIINEEINERDEDKIRKIIRQEVSAIFFELFKNFFLVNFFEVLLFLDVLLLFLLSKSYKFE